MGQGPINVPGSRCPCCHAQDGGSCYKPHVLGHRYRYRVTSALIAGGEAGTCEGTRAFMAAKKVV